MKTDRLKEIALEIGQAVGAEGDSTAAIPILEALVLEVTTELAALIERTHANRSMFASIGIPGNAALLAAAVNAMFDPGEVG